MHDGWIKGMMDTMMNGREMHGIIIIKLIRLIKIIIKHGWKDGWIYGWLHDGKIDKS